MHIIIKIGRIIELVLFFLWELMVANLRVAWDVVTPNQNRHKRPGVIAVPLDVQGDYAITLLACLITLTPGTLSLDVSKDRRVLYIHEMFIQDPDEVRRGIKEGFERRVIGVFK